MYAQQELLEAGAYHQCSADVGTSTEYVLTLVRITVIGCACALPAFQSHWMKDDVKMEKDLVAMSHPRAWAIRGGGGGGGGGGGVYMLIIPLQLLVELLQCCYYMYLASRKGECVWNFDAVSNIAWMFLAEWEWTLLFHKVRYQRSRSQWTCLRKDLQRIKIPFKDS